MKKNKYIKVGILIGENAEMEALALRQTLEYFGFEVFTKWIGRPNDFIDFLRGKLFDSRINLFILCLHGQNQKFVMPKLSKEIYFQDEERKNIGYETINSNILLKDKVLISTACAVGNSKIGNSFTKNNSIFIASKGYVEGNSALLFVQMFMYNLMNFNDVFKAFELCNNFDEEISTFKIFKPI
jgi:hypothetical protein